VYRSETTTNDGLDVVVGCRAGRHVVSDHQRRGDCISEKRQLGTTQRNVRQLCANSTARRGRGRPVSVSVAAATVFLVLLQPLI